MTTSVTLDTERTAAPLPLLLPAGWKIVKSDPNRLEPLLALLLSMESKRFEIETFTVHRTTKESDMAELDAM